MTIPRFTPPVNPSYSSEGKINLRIKKIQYGNGYSQRSTDGVNSIGHTYTLTWQNISKNDYLSILSFLLARQGVEAFKYTVPGHDNIERLYIATGSISHNSIAADVFDISTDIEECFDLI